MIESIQETLDSALGDIDLSGIGPEGDSQYDVTDSEVTVE